MAAVGGEKVTIEWPDPMEAADVQTVVQTSDGQEKSEDTNEDDPDDDTNDDEGETNDTATTTDARLQP